MGEDEYPIVGVVFFFGAILYLMGSGIAACGNKNEHKVSGEVNTNHNVGFEIKHCKDSDGNYRTKCVDDFHAAMQCRLKGEDSGE